MQKKNIEDKMVTVCTTLLPSLKKSIEQYAEKKGIKFGKAIRELLQKAFKNLEGEKK